MILFLFYGVIMKKWWLLISKLDLWEDLTYAMEDGTTVIIS